MNTPGLTHGLLHHAILRHIIDHGYAPDADELASLLGVTEKVIAAALDALAAYHGVVLHPGTSKIWVIHPFSLAPTSFTVTAGERLWWGNCAWCSFGVAALLDQDVTITTALGADRQQVKLHIRNGQLVEDEYYVHFPIPMMQAWDNVVYTCSTMLLFDAPADVDRWCAQHRIARGDVQPAAHIWAFARRWYGSHLNPQWEKWTNAQAKAIFDEFGLGHPVWNLPTSSERF